MKHFRVVRVLRAVVGDADVPTVEIVEDDYRYAEQGLFLVSGGQSFFYHRSRWEVCVFMCACMCLCVHISSSFS